MERHAEVLMAYGQSEHVTGGPWHLCHGSRLRRCRFFVYPILMLLSFPGSHILQLFNEFLLRLGLTLDLPAPFEYSLIGLGMIFIGYLQGFYILPAIVRKTEFVKLLPSRNAKPLTLMIAAQPSASLTSVDSIKPFDDVGRTPLERAIAADDFRTTNAS
jgi:hypothetical protein